MDWIKKGCRSREKFQIIKIIKTIQVQYKLIRMDLNIGNPNEAKFKLTGTA